MSLANKGCAVYYNIAYYFLKRSLNNFFPLVFYVVLFKSLVLAKFAKNFKSEISFIYKYETELLNLNLINYLNLDLFVVCLVSLEVWLVDN